MELKREISKSLQLKLLLLTLVCSLYSGSCIAETTEPNFDNWLDSNRQISTHRWPGKPKLRPYEYKVSREGMLAIRTEYRHLYVPRTKSGPSGYPGDQMIKEFDYLCSSIFGTGLEDLSRAKRWGGKGLRGYPKVVEGSCLSAEKFVSFREEREANKAAAALRQLERQAKKQELQRQNEIRINLERKSKCSSYGFAAGTDAHATCVMELAIAAEANEQQRIANAARAAALARQTEAANAASASADEARRQRQAQALIDLGSAISSGGASGRSISTPTTAPLSSGRYKTCSYRVAGEIVPMTVGRAELCPARRSIGGRTGYLVR